MTLIRVARSLTEEELIEAAQQLGQEYGWGEIWGQDLLATITDLKARLTLNEYQHKARTTAVYPTPTIQVDGETRDVGLLYPALGLAGEAGEVVEQVKRVVRDDGSVLTSQRRDQLQDELGDLLWYLANVAAEAGLYLEQVAANNLHKLQGRANRGILHGSGGER